MEWLWSAPAATRLHTAQEQRRVETVTHTADNSSLLLLLAVGKICVPVATGEGEDTALGLKAVLCEAPLLRVAGMD